MANKRLYELTYVTELSGTSSMLIDDPSYPEAGKLTVDDVRNYVLSGITITNVYPSGMTFNTLTGDLSLKNSNEEVIITTVDGRYIPGKLDGTENMVMVSNGTTLTGYTELVMEKTGLKIGTGVSFPIFIHTGSTNYTVKDTDYTIVCTTSGATITLPDSLSTVVGRMLVIKNYSGYTKIATDTGDKIVTDAEVSSVEKTTVGSSVIVQTDANGKWYSWAG